MALLPGRRSRRRPGDEAAGYATPPLAVPALTIDGFTLAGTPLADRLGGDDLRELTTLLHGIDTRAETPWIYDRAAYLLERAGEHGQALAACEAWLALPAAGWPEHASLTRAITKRRVRLRLRAATPPTSATA